KIRSATGTAETFFRPASAPTARRRAGPSPRSPRIRFTGAARRCIPARRTGSSKESFSRTADARAGSDLCTALIQRRGRQGRKEGTDQVALRPLRPLRLLSLAIKKEAALTRCAEKALSLEDRIHVSLRRLQTFIADLRHHHGKIGGEARG